MESGYRRPLLRQPLGTIKNVAGLNYRHLWSVHALPLLHRADKALDVLFHTRYCAALNASPTRGGTGSPWSAFPPAKQDNCQGKGTVPELPCSVHLLTVWHFPNNSSKAWPHCLLEQLRHPSTCKLSCLLPSDLLIYAINLLVSFQVQKTLKSDSFCMILNAI